MSSYARRLFWAVALVSSLYCVASASNAATYLYLNSQPGDYVGGGVTQTLTPAEGTFTVSSASSTVSISFKTPDYSQFWELEFGTPQSMKFGKGQYVGAQRTAFRSPMLPGVDVGGDGRGCDTDTGQGASIQFSVRLAAPTSLRSQFPALATAFPLLVWAIPSSSLLRQRSWGRE